MKIGAGKIIGAALFASGVAAIWLWPKPKAEVAEETVVRPGKIPSIFAIMVMIVILLFNSIKKTVAIFMTVPLILVGVVAGLLGFDQPFGFMALLGFLSLVTMVVVPVNYALLHNVKSPRLGACAGLLLLAAFAAGCSGDGQDADPRIADASRPVVLVTHPTEPPCAYTNEAGVIVGSDIDLARRIAAKMGRELVIKPVEFSEILPLLKAGKADFGIATITITEARTRDVDFSRPYAFGGACFLYRSKDPKPRMSQAPTLRVGVEADTTGDIYLSCHGCDPLRFIHLEDAVAALEKNEIDVLFFDDMPLKSLAKESGGRYSVSPLVTRDGYGVAVDKRRPDVLAAANAVIAEGGAK